MIRKFNTSLLFTDTDSLCYELYEKNLYKKMYKLKELFDLSNLPASSKYYCNDNKKVLSKMKDEYGGKSIVKFIGLDQKCIQYLMQVIMERSQAKVTMLL